MSSHLEDSHSLLGIRFNLMKSVCKSMENVIAVILKLIDTFGNSDSVFYLLEHT